MTQKERLQNYRNSKDPNYSGRIRLESAIFQVQQIKPEVGYTPVKGKDYFTDIEIQSVISYVMSMVRDGKDGLPGLQGVSGSPGKNGKDGNHGRDGVDGNHGRHGNDGRDGISPSVQAVVDEVLSSLPDVEYHKVKGAPDIKELNDLVAFLKLGGFRGGGSPATSGGSSVTLEIPGGSIDTGNFIFTVLNAPIYILVDGVAKFPDVNYTYVAGTITITDGAYPTQTIYSLHN